MRLDAVFLSHREQAFNFACRPRSAPTHNCGQSWADTERPTRIVERIPWSRLGCLGRTPLDVGFEVLVSARIGNLQVARENVEDASQVRGALNIGMALDAFPKNLDNSLLFERLYSSTMLPAIRHLYCGLDQSFTQNRRFGRVRTDTGCALKVGDTEQVEARPRGSRREFGNA